MKDYIEMLVTKWLIRQLEQRYNKCKGYYEDCTSCEICIVVKFLKKHKKLLERNSWGE
jgi:hypothetical protein